ncbi:hypothetical protein GUITHDRAFT_154829 [Guillardia theta CCMP2712]|uniref:Uncharacterized protein n=1 Tax=Guillardia theta (strain CCMP2712) TaxID=905079 RepID=L1IQ46_GUITC|nr:hypothetical protein GUITHDRAFT_154829 [Guillardia theta CCMP2712]EKX37945.1 hypothetical protein GUITHDRAFT_154829 [Guillardia theta CCMP2712]|eukprot:XP_005824925.1 hypothetical protein GUITHDRAFT_154829 [Guillardia theta CCMP2712]
MKLAMLHHNIVRNDRTGPGILVLIPQEVGLRSLCPRRQAGRFCERSNEPLP